MKSIVNGTFRFVFVIGQFLSFVNVIIGIIILPAWALGLISGENEILRFCLAFGMITYPIAVTLCLTNPEFEAVKENTQGFPPGLVSIIEAKHKAKVSALDVYNKFYTLGFRAFYTTLNLGMWIFVKTHLVSVYDLEARIYLVAGSLITLILMMFICTIYGIASISNKHKSYN